jgi:hypothetical protein
LYFLKQCGVIQKNNGKERHMGKRILFFMIMWVLVFALAGIAYAWQGRMGGMGDPYGLVADESDYLLHPVKIANGEGVRFYGDYRFTYTGVTKWDDRYLDLGDVSGEELGHNVLVGAAFPLWLGRMGFFFTYDGMRGSYDGDSGLTILQMRNNLDNFAWRLMYGLPIGGCFKLGAEVQLAYRQEKQELDDASSSTAALNDLWLHYSFPNDSKYLKALFKGSMEGKVGPLDVELTLRGGVDLPGTNSSEWNYQAIVLPSTPLAAFKANGEVHGWQIGGDLWLRYALTPDLTLPFLVRADYLQRTRDGSGPAFDGFDRVRFRGEVRDLAITVGGGVDKAYGKATRIAAGIYYNFLRGKESFTPTLSNPFASDRMDLTYPDSQEHQLLLRIVGEHVLSPAVTVRAGVNLFYGWVRPELRNDEITSAASYGLLHEGPGHGYDWGFLASLGGTVVVKPLPFEPFVGGGYRQFHAGMSGQFNFSGPPPAIFLASETISRNEWLVNTGLSILFDL